MSEPKRRGRPSKHQAPIEAEVDQYTGDEIDDTPIPVIPVDVHIKYPMPSLDYADYPISKDVIHCVDLTVEDVEDEDILAIEQKIGYTARTWGFVDPRSIIAACINYGIVPKALRS